MEGFALLARNEGILPALEVKCFVHLLHDVNWRMCRLEAQAFEYFLSLFLLHAHLISGRIVFF